LIYFIGEFLASVTEGEGKLVPAEGFPEAEDGKVLPLALERGVVV
jgi:hypothetical protein